MDLNSRKQELAKKYNIDFDKLEIEQINMAKNLTLKDKIDFLLVERYGAVDNIFIKNKILSCFIVCNKDFEIIDQAYVFDNSKFPYLPGFRNYRELPAMIASFEKINEKPDVVFINAHGIIHSRLGLASHFGLFTGVPTIGVSNSLVNCEAEKKDGNDILRNGKKLGKVLIVKPESNPLFISPGDHISIKTAYELSKKLVNLPHKRPEPMHLAAKYANSVKKELLTG